MAIKFGILFLGALLLAQTTYSAPASSGESFFNEFRNIFQQLAARFEIIKMIIDEVQGLDKLVAENGKTVLKKVLEDPKVLEIKTDSMQKNLEEIREYVDKLEKSEGRTKSNLLDFIDFEDFVNKFEKEKVEDLTHEAEVIGKSLKDNGLEEFEATVSEDFEKFAKRFVEKLDGFLDQLPTDDKKDEKPLIDWSNRFASEKDIGKKLNLFDNIFDAVGLDNSKED